MLTRSRTDPEAQQSSVSLVIKQKRGEEGTIGAYRRDVVNSLVFQMMNERFDELSRKPDAQYLDAGAFDSTLSATTGIVQLTASVQEGKIQPGLTALMIEAKRVAQHGFGAAELDRAKKWVTASYERAYSERDKTKATYAGEYVATSSRTAEPRSPTS